MDVWCVVLGIWQEFGDWYLVVVCQVLVVVLVVEVGESDDVGFVDLQYFFEDFVWIVYGLQCLGYYYYVEVVVGEVVQVFVEVLFDYVYFVFDVMGDVVGIDFQVVVVDLFVVVQLGQEFVVVVVEVEDVVVGGNLFLDDFEIGVYWIFIC